jgi:ATP-binding cassette subfamily F protein uup
LEQFLFEGSKQRQKVGALSGGERARVALAKMLKGGANLYLLDEPTNDLDVATLGALEEMLESFRGCALVVSHDRYFLNRVATSILAFEQSDEGHWQVVRYPGNYDTYRTLKAEAEAARKTQQENLRGASRGPGTEPPAKGGDGKKDTRGSASATAAAPVEASTAPAKPLTFAERKELDTIFDTIGTAEERVAALEARLLDPAVYSKADESRAVQTDLEKAKADLVRLTARWEDLEARKDIKKP